MGLDPGAQTPILEQYINAVSGTIEQFLGRKLGENRQTDRLPGFSLQRLYVERTPIASIEEVRIDGVVVAESEYTVSDSPIGELYRQVGWPYTGALNRTIQPGPQVGSEERVIQVDYTGGFVLPPASLATPVVMTGNPLLTFDEAAKTITRDSGDWTVDNFVTALVIHIRGSNLNDGRYIVNGAPSATVLTVTETLVDEDPIGGVFVGQVELLPTDLEQAAILAVSTMFRQKGVDRTINKDKVLSGSVEYNRGGAEVGAFVNGLPPNVAAMLIPYQRAVG